MAEADDRTAFIEEGPYRARAYTYAQVLERARAFADWLRQQETSKSAVDDGSEAPRVVIWAPPSARWAMAFYGCLLAGRVVVPVDSGFSFEFVERVTAQTQASLVVIGTQGFAPLPNGENKTAKESGYETFRLSEIDTLPAVADRPAQPGPAVIDRRYSRDALAEIIYTSGTTAEPRGVMITHGNLLANLEPVEREIRKHRWLAAPFRPLRFLHLIPLSHLFGQIMGLFIPQFLQGLVLFPESQAPSELARIIRKRRVSVMVSVPQQLEALGDWALGKVGNAGVWENQKLEIRKQKENEEELDIEDKLGIEEKLGAERKLGTSESQRLSIPARFWKFRRLHRALGWKMWAFVVGGAALPPRVERLWNEFGYAVIQGYGLTETAPAITITHPFKIRHGSVGQPLQGAEIRLAADGEILVRGANVSPGYYRNQQATQQSFAADGWLRTGDLGKFDAEGNLIFVGRKKDVIVTADGLNVYPEDVERALAAEPGVKEAAVVGRETGSALAGRRTLVHAVVVPETGAGPTTLEAAVASANERLEQHQRIRGYSVWPQPALPRTVSTHKLQRAAVAAWVIQAAEARGELNPPGPSGQSGGPALTSASDSRPDWRDFLAQLGVARDRIKPEVRLSEDLGLSSLDRVELLTWLEARGTFVDGERFTQAHTVADLAAAVGDRESGVGSRESEVAGEDSQPRAVVREWEAESPVPSANPEPRVPNPGSVKVFRHQEPRWPRSWPARAFRLAAERVLMFPLLRTYVRTEVVGAEKLAHLAGPVLWVSNHQSLLDVPVILRALPARLRRRVAPAMGIDALRVGDVPDTARSEAWLHFSRQRRASQGTGPQLSKTLTFLARLFFNTYLLLDDASGVQGALRQAGLLADEGFSTLIFPEGIRTPDGRVARFRPGVGLMAERLHLPVVPLRLEGLYEIWAAAARGPKSGRARVTIFDPVNIEPGESAAQFTARLREIYDRKTVDGRRNKGEKW
ncbi:MAG: AMP-binding protein [Terriglobia bacterium]